MIEVVAGLVCRNGRILLCQKASGKWELAGGKLETGESHAAALERELLEELRIAVRAEGSVASVTHAYPDKAIHLTLVKAIIVSGEPVCTEHSALAWVTPTELPAYNLCAADARLVASLAWEELL